MLLDSLSKGVFVSSPPNEAKEQIETISTNTSFCYNKIDHKARMYEVSNKVMNDAKVEAMGLEIKRLQVMVEKMGKHLNIAWPLLIIVIFVEDHMAPYVECKSTSSESYEHVYVIGNQQCDQDQGYNNYGRNQCWKERSEWTNQNQGGWNQGVRPSAN